MLFDFSRFYAYKGTKKNKTNCSLIRKIMKFGEQGDTIFLRITTKNRIKIQSVAQNMDLCLLKKSIYLYKFAFCILTSYRGECSLSRPTLHWLVLKGA